MYGQKKQYVNLSRHAYETITGDMALFSYKLSFPRFLNLILRNYGLSSKANVAGYLQSKESDLHSLLYGVNLKRRIINKSIIDTNDIDYIISAILEDAEEELFKKILSYEKFKQIVFQLNDENIKLLFEVTNSLMLNDEMDWMNKKYYLKRTHKVSSAMALYIKAILEEYAELHACEREKIIFKDTLELCEKAIDEKYSIRIRLRNASQKVQFQVVPYCLLPDESRNHYYLIGKSRPLNETPNQPASDFVFSSTRLDRFVVEYIYTDHAKLTAKELKSIKSRIINSGVAYVLTEECEVVVRFTEFGLIKYQRIEHQRPAPQIQPSTETMFDEDGLVHFICTERQALNYFTRLCEDVEIIEPESLRLKMQEQYAKANQIYNKTGG